MGSIYILQDAVRVHNLRSRTLSSGVGADGGATTDLKSEAIAKAGTVTNSEMKARSKTVSIRTPQYEPRI
jgi:hypothetical protein